jgi:L-ascorbate oxidase
MFLSVWMIHCHILQHMIMGMQAVWVIGNATEITRGTAPDLVEGYLTYGGNAYGNSTVDPFVTHFYE